jgi:O-antigen/teichoic acid export membrane protein
MAEGVPASELGLRKLGSNIGATLGRQLFVILLGLGTASLAARVLGPTGLGQYAIAMLLPTLLATFLNLGISPANVFFVGRGSVNAKVAARASFQIWAGLALAGAVAAALIIPLYGQQIFPGVTSSMLWLALLVFPLVLLQVYLASVLQGLQDFRRYNLALLLQPGVMFILLATLFVFRVSSVTSVILASVIAHSVDSVVTWILLRQTFTPVQDDDSDLWGYSKKAIGYGYRAHLSNVLSYVNYRADTYLVNLLLHPAAAGVYVIAVAMTEKLWVLSQAVSTVILPRLSELDSEEEVRRQITPLLVRWVMMITLLAAVLLAITSGLLIRVFFGVEYLTARSTLWVLLPGVVLGGLSRILANDIAARGRPELNMYTATLVVIINVTLSVLLIPPMGVLGAALSTSIAYSINFCFFLWMYSWISGNRWYVHFLFNSYDKVILRHTSTYLRNLLCHIVER